MKLFCAVGEKKVAISASRIQILKAEAQELQEKLGTYLM